MKKEKISHRWLKATALEKEENKKRNTNILNNEEKSANGTYLRKLSLNSVFSFQVKKMSFHIFCMPLIFCDIIINKSLVSVTLYYLSFGYAMIGGGGGQILPPPPPPPPEILAVGRVIATKFCTRFAPDVIYMIAQLDFTK